MAEALKPVLVVLDQDAIRDILAGEPLVLELEPLGAKLTITAMKDEKQENAVLAQLLDAPVPRHMH